MRCPCQQHQRGTRPAIGAEVASCSADASRRVYLSGGNVFQCAAPDEAPIAVVSIPALHARQRVTRYSGWRLAAGVGLLVLLAASLASAQGVSRQRLSPKSITTFGTDCSVAAACATLTDVYGTGGGSIQLTGTFTGLTANFEGTLDGTNWGSLSMTPLAGGTAVTSGSAVGIWTYAAALIGVRVRASALSTGSVVVSIVAR